MLITTVHLGQSTNEGCFCFCKGNQFYANHNGSMGVFSFPFVVFAFAKVLNFMLITTDMYGHR